MKAIIYGKPGCTNCDKAKMLCMTKSVPFEYKTLGADIQLEQLEEMTQTRVQSVPQIFLSQNGFFEYVGGYQDLIKKIS